MAATIQSIAALTPEEAAERRRAVGSAIGSLRIEGIELEPAEHEILERHAQGEINLATMDGQMDSYIEA